MYACAPLALMGVTHLSGTEAIHLIVKRGNEAPLVGARFLATRSRGVAPKTRGQGIASNCDPVRVSHWLPDSLISATPWRGRISLLASSPAVFGTSRLDMRAKKRRSLRGFAPAGSAGGCIRRGISRRRSPLHSGKDQMRQPWL